MDQIVQRWLDGYLRAWESNDPDDIRALFVEEATYAGGPFDPEPWIGRDGIIDGWVSHRNEPGTWTFEGTPLVAENDIGIVQGVTRYDDGRVYANLWVIAFASDGRARSFVEWFMEPGPVRQDQMERPSAAMNVETGWISAAGFHRTAGVSDWRVTATGPQAVFTAKSLTDGARLFDPIMAAAERFGVLPDIDVRAEGVIVRLPHRGPEGIPAAAGDFAAAVSAAATDLSLSAAPSLVQSIGIYVAQHSEADVRPFFTAALGYEPFGDGDAVDRLRSGPHLAFNPLTGDSPARGRTHFDVFVPADQAQARVEAALAAGGRLVDDSHAPAWWSLASPDNHGVDIASWTDTDE